MTQETNDKAQEQTASEAQNERHYKRLSHVTIIISLMMLVGLVVFMWCTGAFKSMTSLEAFRTYIDRFGGWAYVVFWICQFAGVIIAPIPGNVTTLAGGLAFGFGWGILLSLSAILAGSIAAFWLVRRLGKNFAHRVLGRRMATKYHELFTRKRDVFLFLTMLFPFFPDDVICMLAGLTDIPTGRFVKILLITKPWGLIVSAILGAYSMEMPMPLLIAFGVLMVAIFVLGLIYGDRVQGWLRSKFSKQGKTTL